MYQLANTPDHRIAQYTFGKSISQFGMTVFSCNKAREGKKIFGNDLTLRGNMYWIVKLI